MRHGLPLGRRAALFAIRCFTYRLRSSGVPGMFARVNLPGSVQGDAVVHARHTARAGARLRRDLAIPG